MEKEKLGGAHFGKEEDELEIVWSKRRLPTECAAAAARLRGPLAVARRVPAAESP